MLFGVSIIRIIIALIAMFVIIRTGLALLRGIGAPVPEPPPPGELRKVKIQFQCLVCGSEVRMTMSNDEDPEPPRHCMQEMSIVAPTIE